jgi:uncharacterized protein
MKNPNTTVKVNLAKIGLIVFILALLPFKSLFAGEPGKSLLYKISGNGLESPSYLYGTIHMICGDQFFITDATQKALEEVQSIVLEIDMSDPSLMQKMQMLAVHPEMRNISGSMTEEEAAAFDEYLMANFGAGLAQIGIMKPFVLTSMLVTTHINCTDIKSYEGYFMEYATQKSVPVKGLEEVEFQVSLFDQIPYEEQVHELVKMVVSPEEGKRELDQMMACYASQDINCLYEVILNSSSMKDYKDLLLFERNRNWVPLIVEQMANEQVFVAVGAGHLPGEEGLIELLKRAGYRVEAVL